MPISLSEEDKELIRVRALSLGAFRCGFAEAAPVDADAQNLYDSWIAQGKHGEMSYCAKYADVRHDPRMLLEGCLTIVSCAFGYGDIVNAPILPVSLYARGLDYHFVIKEKLAVLGAFIESNYGGRTRTLVDTAPMRERYWAQRAGIGFIGVNNQLIVPDAGSAFFLGELLWTGKIDPDEPCYAACDGCMACVKACPGHALDGCGGCDARKCVSYLTIEYREELPIDANLAGSVYGCDICQRVCPHNYGATPPEALAEFAPNQEIMALNADKVMDMTSSHYRRITKRSAMQRVSLKQLQRNALHHIKDN